MADSYSLKILADTAQYQQELAKIPGVTEKQAASAALKMAQQMARGATSAGKSASDAAKAASDSTAKAVSGLVDRIGSSTEKLGKGLGIISPTLQSATRAVGDLADGLTAALTPTGAMVAGIAAIGATLATPIALTGALSAGLVKLGFSANDSYKNLQKFAAFDKDFIPGVSQETIASFERLSATGAALSSVWDRLTVVAGAAVAPALDRVASVAVGLALKGEQLAEIWLAGGNVFETLAASTLVAFGNALLIPLQPIKLLAESFKYLADIAGIQLPQSIQASIGLLEKITDPAFQQKMALQAVRAVENSDAMTALGGALSGVEAEGRKFLTTQNQVTEATKASGKAAKEAADDVKAFEDALKADQKIIDDVMRSFSDGQKASEHQYAESTLKRSELIQRETDQQIAEYDRQLRALQETGATEQQLKDAQLAHDKAVNSARTASAIEMQKAIRTESESTVSAVNDIFGGLSSFADSMTESLDPEKQKSAWKAAFAVSKAAAIAQALLNTALAISTALAAPLPPPGPQIAAGVAAATGTLAVAQVAATQPPKFHTGTSYAAPGEFSATLQTGEAVLSRQAMSVSGRRETVEKWNSGGGAEKPASDEFAAGIERSSLPQLLSQTLKYQRATMLRLGVDPSRTDRPGHRRR